MNDIKCVLDVIKELNSCIRQTYKKPQEIKKKLSLLSSRVEELYGTSGAGYLNQLLVTYKLISDPNNEVKEQSLADKILPLCQLAYLEEKNGRAEEHAQKLALIFNDERSVLEYLLTYVKQNTYKYMLHDACLFELPEQDEQWSYWKKMANQKDIMANPRFRELLPLAKEINQLIKDEEKKRQTHDLMTIKTMKQAVLAKNKEYKHLEQTPVIYPKNDPELAQRMKAERKLKLAVLSQERSVARIELAKYCVHLSWEHIDIPVLQAFYEQYQEQSNKAHKILVKHGISARHIAEFESLDKVNDDEAIPDVVIDGSKIGCPGYHLRRLDMTNEEDAALAACLGKLTNCCQYLGGAGSDCAKHGISSPNGGFYVLYKGNELVGQSWVWRGNGLCFDSVESSGVSKDIVADMYRYLAYTLVNNPDYKISQVNVGANSGISTKVGFKGYTPVKIHNPGYKGYTDAAAQLLVAHVNKPYLFFSKMNSQEFNALIAADLHSLLESRVKNEDVLKDNEVLKESIGFALYSENSELLSVLGHVLANRKEELDVLLNQNKAYFAALNANSIELGYVAQGAYLSMMNRKGLTALHLAVLNADEAMVKQLLQLGIHSNSQDKLGNTALMMALETVWYEKKNPQGKELAKLLIDAGAELDIKDKDENTPLLLAVRHNDIEMVHYLVDKGANLDIHDECLKMAIYWAAERGYEEIFHYLLEHKAIVDGADLHKENNILMVACASGKISIVSALLKQGIIDWGHKNKETENVLHFALDNPEILQCLLENMPLKQAQELMFSHQYSSYSPIRKSFHRPQTFQLFWNLITEEQKLYIAVVKGDLAAVQNLLLSGVNIHTQDQDGQTILIHALNEIHLTKLHNTASNSVEEKTKRTIAQLLIDSGADLNVKDKYGTSPLIFAVRHGDLEMVQSMVEKGAALEACDAHNETALYHAAIKGFADIFIYLLDKQADIHVINDKKNNILMEACASWNIDLVRFLLAKKCFDLGYKNHNGDNALHFALTNESKLQYLLDELPLAQAVNLVFSHEKHNQSVIERSLSYSKSFSLLWDILPPGQSYSRTEPAVLDTLQSLLYSALSKNKADLVQQLVSKVSFDFIKMAQTGRNVFRAVLGNRSLLTLLLEYMPREQAIELMLIPDKWGDTVLYENHDYPESLEPLLMLVPAEGRLKLVKEQKCNRTTTRNYEKSLFDHVFRYAEFLRAMPPSDLPQIVKTVFENGNTFFHQTTYNPESIKIGLEIYPEAERLSKLTRPNEHGFTAFESMGYNPDAIKVLLELLPYKDIVTFIKSANSKGRFNLFTLSNYGSLKLILQFLKPEDRESVLCMQDSNKCSLVYKEKTGELLELLSINKRYQVVCSGLKEVLAYYDKNYSHDENTKFVEIIKSLPLEQRWDFLELIESEKKGKAHELLKEHLAELMDLLPPSKRFDALLFTDKANDTVFRGLVYYPEKLKLALEQLTNEQHFNMVCQKTPLTYTLLSANRKNTEAVDIILSGLTPQQQLIVVKESQAADGVFISSIVRKPELLKRILDLYPPEERWQVLITSSRSLGKTPLHKMVKNEESLQVAFNALPDACRGAFLNYRVFGHSVQEFMDKKVDLTLCHYTYRKDIVTLLRQSRKDENLRFFAARPEIKTFRDIIDNDDLNAQKMEMYQLFQSLDFESPFFKNFVEATYPNKMLDKETVLSRFKMNWDMSDEDIMNSKTNRFTSAL
jgi:ankyrin repeat protein/uncharacterized protein YdcH (DUF465 family)